MNRSQVTRFSVMAAGVALTASLAAGAQGPMAAKYPAYGRAYSDLRDARAYLGEKGTKMDVRQEDEKVIREIDVALTDIKRAAVDDGRGLDSHAPVDASLDRAGRYAKVNALLDTARQDIAGAGDIGEAKGTHDRVLHDIDVARESVHQSIVLLKRGK